MLAWGRHEDDGPRLLPQHCPAAGPNQAAVSGVVIGLAIGMLAAVFAARLMDKLLFGITPLDPVSFAMAPLVLLAVALAACIVPAMRASRIDPAEALRSE